MSDLAAYYVIAGLDAEQLATPYELDLARVHAALAYYYDHKAEIDAEIRTNGEDAESWRKSLAAQGLSLAV